MTKFPSYCDCTAPAMVIVSPLTKPLLGSVTVAVVPLEVTEETVWGDIKAMSGVRLTSW